MLHVTQVQTRFEEEAQFYYYKDDRKSQSELSVEVKIPDPAEQVPQDPPFVALVSNLPMECNERELRQVFTDFSICTLIVPKKGKRPKGFAYVEVESREELIRLLQLEKLKCRGRLLSIKVSPDREIIASGKVGKGVGRGVTRGAGGGDAHFTPLTISDFDGSSAHYSASVSDLSTIDSSSSPGGSPRCPGSESSIYDEGMPIRRQPSSTDELERRMDIRLQKLAEFENAQSEREQGSLMDDQDDISFMSWSDVLSETRKSEGL